MKNAFTLIELLAVFILLAIIALITTSVILAVGKDSKESLYKTQKEMVIEAAKKWTIENEYKIDSSYNLTLEELYDDGYLVPNFNLDLNFYSKEEITEKAEKIYKENLIEKENIEIEMEMNE